MYILYVSSKYVFLMKFEVGFGLLPNAFNYSSSTMGSVYTIFTLKNNFTLYDMNK